MELFTIAIAKDMEAVSVKLQALLKEHTNHALHNAKPGVQLQAAVDYDILEDRGIRCKGILPGFRLAEHGHLVYQGAANAIAEFILSELEAELVLKMIRRKHHNIPALETEAIEKYCEGLLKGMEWDQLGSRFQEADRNRRKKKIADEVELYLSEHAQLQLQGFVRFRLQNYRSELKDIVEYAMDEYVLDKQYQEFISLLKYFVQLQESKVSIVHLLHKGGHEFMLYNSSFQPIEPKPPSDRIVAEMLETEMNIEDMVISSLISVSPKQIVVHTRQAEMQVIRTIQTIFDDRVSVCVDCSSCSQTLDELIKP
ncbi:putative sporulation protein YtxC [Paenibacillus sp. HB172176]|uniref:putative sporulation protein YtxC n=1 Tax=Paenibacillus sp. HB172176 TaxID=2493690 RepID=UPI00143AD573|nr:putative sporulation protein YtxC [Paenibacillus sp. HB172176]